MLTSRVGNVKKKMEVMKQRRKHSLNNPVNGLIAKVSPPETKDVEGSGETHTTFIFRAPFAFVLWEEPALEQSRPRYTSCLSLLEFDPHLSLPFHIIHDMETMAALSPECRRKARAEGGGILARGRSVQNGVAAGLHCVLFSTDAAGSRLQRRFESTF